MKKAKKAANAVYKTSSDISWRKVGDEAVLLNVKTSAYYSLNATGARIWEMIGEQKPSDEIITALSEEFGVPQATAEKDFDDLIDTLLEENLLNRAD